MEGYRSSATCKMSLADQMIEPTTCPPFPDAAAALMMMMQCVQLLCFFLVSQSPCPQAAYLTDELMSCSLTHTYLCWPNLRVLGVFHIKSCDVYCISARRLSAPRTNMCPRLASKTQLEEMHAWPLTVVKVPKCCSHSQYTDHTSPKAAGAGQSQRPST